MERADWTQRIVELVLVKQKLAELDTKGLWQYRLPAVAASEAKLEAVEAHLGEALDPAFRAFLLHADGWPAFYQTVDLFGSDDLLVARRCRAVGLPHPAPAFRWLAPVSRLALPNREYFLAASLLVVVRSASCPLHT